MHSYKTRAKAREMRTRQNAHHNHTTGIFAQRERGGEREREWGGREEVREKEGDREGERLRER